MGWALVVSFSLDPRVETVRDRGESTQSVATEFTFLRIFALKVAPIPGRQIRLAASPSVVSISAPNKELGHVPFHRPSRRFPTFDLRRRQCMPPRLKDARAGLG